MIICDDKPPKLEVTLILKPQNIGNTSKGFLIPMRSFPLDLDRYYLIKIKVVEECKL